MFTPFGQALPDLSHCCAFRSDGSDRCVSANAGFDDRLLGRLIYGGRLPISEPGDIANVMLRVLLILPGTG
jgi:hypothetical protein